VERSQTESRESRESSQRVIAGREKSSSFTQRRVIVGLDPAIHAATLFVGDDAEHLSDCRIFIASSAYIAWRFCLGPVGTRRGDDNADTQTG
jgi:hypothetical protein